MSEPVGSIKNCFDENVVDERHAIPEDVMLATPDDLAKELLDFVKSNSSNEDLVNDLYRYKDLFWKKKKVDSYDLPIDVELKKQKVDDLVEKLVRELQEERRHKTLMDEKKIIPELVHSCVIWANGKGLKKVTKADVDVFLAGKSLLVETVREVYGMVNIELKQQR